VGAAISIVDALSSSGFVQPHHVAVFVEILEEIHVDEFSFPVARNLIVAPLGKQKSLEENPIACRRPVSI
jgi:hypothetical protein